MSDLIEKLDKLGEYKWNERDGRTISLLRERRPYLMAVEDWLNHPITLEWMERKRKRLNDIKNELSESPDLPDRLRERLFGEKAAIESDLNNLKVNPQGELETIESHADELLDKAKGYL